MSGAPWMRIRFSPVMERPDAPGGGLGRRRRPEPSTGIPAGELLNAPGFRPKGPWETRGRRRGLTTLVGSLAGPRVEQGETPSPGSNVTSSMDYRRLGRTGLKVSELCLGTMQFGWTTDEAGAIAVMDAFVEAGGN